MFGFVCVCRGKLVRYIFHAESFIFFRYAVEVLTNINGCVLTTTIKIQNIFIIPQIP